MAKALEIKRIELLVYPFFGLGISYGKIEADKWFKLWKKHIDEVARDPNRLLLIKQEIQVGKSLRGMIEENDLLKLAKTKELVEYAKKELKERFGFYEPDKSKFAFYDYLEKGFKSFGKFAKAKGFAVDAKKVKTRGFGEFTIGCITDYLIKLNKKIGLKNVIPYRNRQSTILPRKSIAFHCHYPKPWKLKDLLKTDAGKKIIQSKMEKYIERRRAEANWQLGRQRGSVKQFKPRPHLMKKRKA